MAQARAIINIDVNTSAAAAQLRTLQNQINSFGATLNKNNLLQAEAAQLFSNSLMDAVSATRFFTAEQVKMETAARRLDQTLSKGQGTLGQYFNARFRKDSAEAAAVLSLANARAQALQTTFIETSAAAKGFRDTIAIRPLAAFNSEAVVANERLAIHRAMLRQATTSMINFGKNTQWAGRQLMVGFTVPLTIFGGAAAKTFKEIEQAAVRFKKVYGDAFTSPAEIEKNMKAVEGLALEFTKYGIAVSDTIGLAAEAAAAGAKNAELIAATTEATRLATLGQMEQSEALSATIALQNAFKLSAQDLATEVNFLNMVENQTVVTLQDLAEAIPRVAPVIVGLGGDVRDMAAMLAAMQEGGVSAAQGANALKSGLGSLINPTEKASKTLKDMGINLNAIVQANRGDLMGTVTAFAQELSKLDKFTRQQALEELFGKYQYARLGALFDNIIKDGTQASRVLQIAGMSAQDMAKSAERELSVISEATSTKFTGALERFKLAIAPIGEMFMKISTPILNFLSKLFEMFDKLPDGVKNFAAIGTVIVGVVVPAGTMFLGLLMNLVGTLIKFGNIIGSVVKGFGKGGFSGAIQAVSQSLNYMSLEEMDAANAANQLGTATKNANAALLAQITSADSATAAFTELAAAINLAARAQQNYAESYPLAFQPGATAARQAGNAPQPPRRGPQRRNSGGPIFLNDGNTVPGFGNKDTVPAMLTPGEFVVNKEATQQNLPLLYAINNGGSIPGFNKGGGIAKNGKMFYGRYAKATARKMSLDVNDLPPGPMRDRLLEALLSQGGSQGLPTQSSTAAHGFMTLPQLSAAERSSLNNALKAVTPRLQGVEPVQLMSNLVGAGPSFLNAKARFGQANPQDMALLTSLVDFYLPTFSQVPTARGVLSNLGISPLDAATAVASRLPGKFRSIRSSRISDQDIALEVAQAFEEAGLASLHTALMSDRNAIRYTLPTQLTNELRRLTPGTSVHDSLLSRAFPGDVSLYRDSKGRPGYVLKSSALGLPKDLLLMPGQTYSTGTGMSYEDISMLQSQRAIESAFGGRGLTPSELKVVRMHLGMNKGGMIPGVQYLQTAGKVLSNKDILSRPLLYKYFNASDMRGAPRELIQARNIIFGGDKDRPVRISSILSSGTSEDNFIKLVAKLGGYTFSSKEQVPTWAGQIHHAHMRGPSRKTKDEKRAAGTYQKEFDADFLRYTAGYENTSLENVFNELTNKEINTIEDLLKKDKRKGNIKLFRQLVNGTVHPTGPQQYRQLKVILETIQGAKFNKSSDYDRQLGLLLGSTRLRLGNFDGLTEKEIKTLMGIRQGDQFDVLTGTGTNKTVSQNIRRFMRGRGRNSGGIIPGVQYLFGGGPAIGGTLRRMLSARQAKILAAEPQQTLESAAQQYADHGYASLSPAQRVLLSQSREPFPGPQLFRGAGGSSPLIDRKLRDRLARGSYTDIIDLEGEMIQFPKGSWSTDERIAYDHMKYFASENQDWIGAIDALTVRGSVPLYGSTYKEHIKGEQANVIRRIKELKSQLKRAQDKMSPEVVAQEEAKLEQLRLAVEQERKNVMSKYNFSEDQSLSLTERAFIRGEVDKSKAQADYRSAQQSHKFNLEHPSKIQEQIDEQILSLYYKRNKRKQAFAEIERLRQEGANVQVFFKATKSDRYIPPGEARISYIQDLTKDDPNDPLTTKLYVIGLDMGYPEMIDISHGPGARYGGRTNEYEYIRQNKGGLIPLQHFNNGGIADPIKAFATGNVFESGGKTIVPGVGNTDTVPAALTPGEFVVNKRATAENLPLLNAINSGEISGFNKGGQIPGVQYFGINMAQRVAQQLRGRSVGRYAKDFLTTKLVERRGIHGGSGALRTAPPLLADQYGWNWPGFFLATEKSAKSREARAIGYAMGSKGTMDWSPEGRGLFGVKSKKLAPKVLYATDKVDPNTVSKVTRFLKASGATDEQVNFVKGSRNLDELIYKSRRIADEIFESDPRNTVNESLKSRINNIVAKNVKLHEYDLMYGLLRPSTYAQLEQRALQQSGGSYSRMLKVTTDDVNQTILNPNRSGELDMSTWKVYEKQPTSFGKSYINAVKENFAGKTGIFDLSSVSKLNKLIDEHVASGDTSGLGAVERTLMQVRMTQEKIPGSQRELRAIDTLLARIDSAPKPPPIMATLNSGNIVPGFGNKDTVPAMLTPGEFVVNKQATQNNLPLLHAINGGSIPGFMKGGMIPSVQYLQDGGLTIGYDERGNPITNPNTAKTRAQSGMPIYDENGRQLSNKEIGKRIATSIAQSRNRVTTSPRPNQPNQPRVPRVGRGMGVSMGLGAVGGAMMMAPMIPQVQENQQLTTMLTTGGMALSVLSVLPMLGKFGIALGGLAAIAAAAIIPFKIFRENMDKAAEESMKIGENIGGVAGRMEKISEATGYQFSLSRASDRMFRFNKKDIQGMSQFSGYFEGEKGQKFIEDLKKLSSKERYQKVSSMIAQGVADGMDPKTAKEYGYMIAYYANDSLLKSRLFEDFKAGKYKKGTEQLVNLVSARQAEAEKQIQKQTSGRSLQEYYKENPVGGQFGTGSEGIRNRTIGAPVALGLAGAAVGGGLLAGASIGALTGSIVPIIGTAIGAVIGAGLGLGAAYFMNQSHVQQLEKNTRLASASLGSSLETLKEVANAEQAINEARLSGAITATQAEQQLAKLRQVEAAAASNVKTVVEQMSLGNVDAGSTGLALKNSLILNSGFSGEQAQAVVDTMDFNKIAEQLFPNIDPEEIKNNPEYAAYKDTVSSVITETLTGITPENAASKIADIQDIYTQIARDLVDAAKKGLETGQGLSPAQVRAEASGQQAELAFVDASTVAAPEGQRTSANQFSTEERNAARTRAKPKAIGGQVYDVDPQTGLVFRSNNQTSFVDQLTKQFPGKTRLDPVINGLSIRDILGSGGDYEMTADDTRALSELARQMGMQASDVLANWFRENPDALAAFKAGEYDVPGLAQALGVSEPDLQSEVDIIISNAEAASAAYQTLGTVADVSGQQWGDYIAELSLTGKQVDPIVNAMSALVQADSELANQIVASKDQRDQFVEFVEILSDKKYQNIDMTLAVQYAFDNGKTPEQVKQEIDDLNKFVANQNLGKEFGKKDAKVIKAYYPNSNEIYNAYMKAYQKAGKALEDQGIKNAEQWWSAVSKSGDEYLNKLSDDINEKTGKIKITPEVAVELFGVEPKSANEASNILNEIFGNKPIDPSYAMVIATLQFSNPEAFALLSAVAKDKQLLEGVKSGQITGAGMLGNGRYISQAQYDAASAIISGGLENAFNGGGGGGGGGGGTKPILQQLNDSIKELDKIFKRMQQIINGKIGTFKNFMAGPFAPQFIEFLKSQGEEGIKILTGNADKFLQVYKKYVEQQQKISRNQLQALPFSFQEQARAIQGQSRMEERLTKAGIFGADARSAVLENISAPDQFFGTLTNKEFQDFLKKEKVSKSQRKIYTDMRKGAIQNVKAATSGRMGAQSRTLLSEQVQAESTNLDNRLKYAMDPNIPSEFTDKLLEAGITVEDLRGKYKNLGAELYALARQQMGVNIAENLKKMNEDVTVTNNILQAVPGATQEFADELRSLGINALSSAQDIQAAAAALVQYKQRLEQTKGPLQNFAEALDIMGSGVSFEIEKINKLDIEPIQKQIDKLNESIDALEKSKRPHQDAIDKLREQEQALQKVYDERIKALEEVERVNARIAAQQQGQMNVASALSRGDIAGAAQAALDLQKTMADQRTEDLRVGIDTQYDAERSAITEKIKFNEDAIKNIDNQILTIQDNIALKQKDIEAAKQKQVELEEKLYRIQLLREAVQTRMAMQEAMTRDPSEAALYQPILASQVATLGQLGGLQNIPGAAGILALLQQPLAIPQGAGIATAGQQPGQPGNFFGGIGIPGVTGQAPPGTPAAMFNQTVQQQLPVIQQTLTDLTSEETGLPGIFSKIKGQFVSFITSLSDAVVALQNFVQIAITELNAVKVSAINAINAKKGEAIAAVMAAGALAAAMAASSGGKGSGKKSIGGFISRAFGGGINYRGSRERAPGMAMGSFVPGIGNSDKVPVLLTPGEFVVRKSVAQQFKDELQALNSQVHPNDMSPLNAIAEQSGVMAPLKRAFGGIIRGMNPVTQLKDKMIRGPKPLPPVNPVNPIQPPPMMKPPFIRPQPVIPLPNPTPPPGMVRPLPVPSNPPIQIGPKPPRPIIRPLPKPTPAPGMPIVRPLPVTPPITKVPRPNVPTPVIRQPRLPEPRMPKMPTIIDDIRGPRMRHQGPGSGLAPITSNPLQSAIPELPRMKKVPMPRFVDPSKFNMNAFPSNVGAGFNTGINNQPESGVPSTNTTINSPVYNITVNTQTLSNANDIAQAITKRLDQRENRKIRGARISG